MISRIGSSMFSNFLRGESNSKSNKKGNQKILANSWLLQQRKSFFFKDVKRQLMIIKIVFKVSWQLNV